MRTIKDARTAVGAQTAKLSDGATAYTIHGTDNPGPWVILVHGLLTPGLMWAPLADSLAMHGFRVLRYDQYGRGLSDRPDIHYEPDLYDRQLRELMDALGIDHAHLIGWSMGGVINTRFAAAYPHEVASLTLIAPALFQTRPPALRLLGSVPGHGKLVAWRINDVIERLERAHLSKPERFPSYTDLAGQQLEFPGVGKSLASTLDHFPWNAGPEYRAAGTHPRPTLLIWGSDDTTTPYANHTRVLDLYPQAEMLTIDGGKHAPHLDHAEAVLPALLPHLA